MLDSFVFENHLGQRFNGLENNVFLNYNNLRDYSWSYEAVNSRITRFYNNITSRKIPLVICCDSSEEAFEVRNRLCEIAEADIEARLPGKVYIGDYYTTGYITASKKGNYLINKRLYTVELTLTSNDPTWYKESKIIFTQGETAMGGVGGGADYAYDYPHDYAVYKSKKTFNCDSVRGGAFRLLIYGPAVDPSVVIGNHIYTVYGTINQRETLLIDSLNKTITLTTITGSKVNWFDHRGRESYIFEPIAPGLNPVSRVGSFGFDLTVIEKRSEPKWT